MSVFREEKERKGRNDGNGSEVRESRRWSSEREEDVCDTGQSRAQNSVRERNKDRGGKGEERLRSQVSIRDDNSPCQRM